MSPRALFIAALCVATSSLGACGADDANNGAAANATPTALSCIASQVRMCPCVGSTVLGTQLCNATGNGYSACTGCPPPPMQSAMAGATSAMAGATAGAAGTIAGAAGVGAAGASGAAGMTGGSAGTTMTDSGTPDQITDASEPAPAGEVAPGTSCGVGLVSQCALDTEKCCVRSLATDTCIAAADTCSCNLPNCTVMEAHCDGPEDCADGEYCCGTLSQSAQAYDTFECAAQCDVNGSQRAACHQQDPQCPSGLECANSQLLTNVQVCIDPATIQQ